VTSPPRNVGRARFQITENPLLGRRPDEPLCSNRIDRRASFDYASAAPEDLHRFVAQCKLGVLATVSSSVTPQSALMGVAVTPQLEVIFDTIKSSRKYANLIARSACSFVLGWANQHTVEYEGEPEALNRSQPRRCHEV
jgi:hypothetical protein